MRVGGTHHGSDVVQTPVSVPFSYKLACFGLVPVEDPWWVRLGEGLLRPLVVPTLVLLVVLPILVLLVVVHHHLLRLLHCHLHRHLHCHLHCHLRTFLAQKAGHLGLVQWHDRLLRYRGRL